MATSRARTGLADRRAEPTTLPEAVPLISIVLPFHNAASTLPECLDSIQRQTESDFELLAIDDGSQDVSPLIVQERARRDPRIRLLRPGRIGLVAALNLGLSAARAPLIARMDADDIMHPDRLRLQREYLASHPEVALVGSRVELFPAEQVRAGYREYVRWQNHCLSPEEIATNLYVESPLAHPSVMLRREVLAALDGYRDGDFPEDYDLWLRMHHRGFHMAKLPQTLLRWREQGNRTSRVDPRYAREAFDRLRAHFLAADRRLTEDGNRPVVIWGAGRKTRQRVRHLLGCGVRPAARIDVDPRKIGNRFWELPVHPPEWLARSPRPLVLVYVTNHGARELIEERLEDYGYRKGRDFFAVG